MLDNDELTITVSYEPIGVVAAICPWNFPLVLAVAKIAAALITGNCIITKPSPFTPYSILKFTELVRGIFPAGVLQALHGSDMLGPRLCDHPGIDKISFTGSTTTGKAIMAAASRTMKRVTLELGGNNASIVCPDVDVSLVAPQVAIGSFFNSGQLCVASKRIYVHESIYDEFLKVMTSTVRSWRVGPADVTGTMLGPIQNEAQFRRVTALLEDTAAKGYELTTNGGDDVLLKNNYVIPPTIVANPPDDSLVVTEEAFGAVPHSP